MQQKEKPSSWTLEMFGILDKKKNDQLSEKLRIN